MTKTRVVMVPQSMLPRPKQIDAVDLRLGSCVDQLVPALRAEIDTANGQSDKIIEWQNIERARYEKAP